MGSRQYRTYGLHLLLFCVTLITTTIAGAEWQFGKLFFLGPQGFDWTGTFTWAEYKAGLNFSLPFLGVLTVHEFGHYFTARHYRTYVTLPYYIPLWFGVTFSIGTMGAFIRIKERIFSRRQFFDIGVAGPLAGFVVAVPLLFYAFTHLPPADFIFKVHPEYKQFGLNYAQHVYQEGVGNFAIGRNLLFMFFEQFVADPSLVPNQYEVIHYPYVFAGFLALFFTSLNLLPIGQLDGGHVLYGLIGYRRFNRLSPIFFTLFILYAGLGVISPHNVPVWEEDLLLVFAPFAYWAWWKILGDRRQGLAAALGMLLVQYSLSGLFPLAEAYMWLWPFYALYLVFVLQPATPKIQYSIYIAAAVLILQVLVSFFFPEADGYSGWLVFGLLLSREMGIFHPSCPDEQPLTPLRKALGILAFVIFILCFTPAPFIIK
ncbi:peptidase M50-like protein [Pontibacter ummariensis]|uniref:Peptidase family M50 n=1 Tax=Pontibacter ummariensis TaxID=1610492 RepID=A0A239EQ52_9BACT|nr:site-2 protease family protein [Pontibacter ummariensis]PRY12803.1 peptidase M50-like protein [Pontibacter ummariensis]SNS46777.1 Peptidase family M50 [Pontibacter ummariensis]